jgi:hypothetical protein
MKYGHRLRAILGVVIGMFAAASLGGAQRDADQLPPFSDSSPLTIVAVNVEPPNPGPDTLCKLQVRIRNGGKAPASDLSFRVTVNNQRLASYVNHTFRVALAPGRDTEVPLYNFWSSETGRAYPPDGRLVVEVRLIGGRWVAESGSKTSTGAVEPLPAPLSVTLVRSQK